MSTAEEQGGVRSGLDPPFSLVDRISPFAFISPFSLYCISLLSLSSTTTNSTDTPLPSRRPSHPFSNSPRPPQLLAVPRSRPPFSRASPPYPPPSQVLYTCHRRSPTTLHPCPSRSSPARLLQPPLSPPTPPPPPPNAPTAPLPPPARTLLALRPPRGFYGRN